MTERRGPGVAKPSKKTRILKAFRTILVVGFVFWLGWAFGSGNLRFQLPSNLANQNNQLPDNLNYSSVEAVYDTLRARYDGKLSEEQLLNGLKAGLAESTDDPYTEYMTAEQTKEFREDLNNSFSGIGAQLEQENEAIIIVSPIVGFPAEKAGLKAKDIIVEINGQPAVRMSVSEAVSKIRGPVGSQVKLKVARNGQELNFTITRQNITIPSVKTEILSGNIGYMQITQFNEETISLVRKAADSFKARNIKGIIVDVRGNPGGLLNAAVDVASLWVNQRETVLAEKRGGQVIKTYDGGMNPTLREVPTVVLIDGASASASEIVAGALKDNGLAELIGVTSFGKGSVQQLESLPGGSALKVTIARWFTPNGRNIDKEGIAPDQKVERSAKDVKATRDPQKAAAIDYLLKMEN